MGEGKRFELRSGGLHIQIGDSVEVQLSDGRWNCTVKPGSALICFSSFEIGLIVKETTERLVCQDPG